MLKGIASLLVMLALAMGMSATVYAENAAWLRVITLKTDDVPDYLHELDKGNEIVKRLGLSYKTRVWRATFAGPNAGTLVVSQEFASFAAFADYAAKTSTDAEFTQWIKRLDGVRTITSDSLYKALY